MKEFNSPYHALAAQAQALTQLIEAIRNAAEHDLHLLVEYRYGCIGSPVTDKVEVRAWTRAICEYDEDKIPVPEYTDWDISYLFRRESQHHAEEEFCLYLSESHQP